MSDIVEQDREWPSSVDHGPFKAERHESGWWIITNARGSEVDDSGDGGFTEKSALWIAEAMNDKHDETILALRAAINDVLTHRRGELPTLGYIRDNDESRAAIARLAALTSDPEQ